MNLLDKQTTYSVKNETKFTAWQLKAYLDDSVYESIKGLLTVFLKWTKFSSWKQSLNNCSVKIA